MTNHATKTFMLLSLMAAAPAMAQPQATPPGTQPATTLPARNGNGGGHITSQPGGGLLVNFQDASIDSVLNELSSVAGFIVVKEVRPEGRVTLVSKQVVTPAEAVGLLNTVLKNAGTGYAAIQQGRILKIISRDKAKHANIPVRSGADPTKIEATDELITQVIPLKYADASQLKQDLGPLINPDADFTANQSSNALVITDTSANIRRIVEIVSALDTSLADSADVRVVKLTYASADSAAKLINDLFGDASRSRGGQNDQSQFSRFGFFGGGGFPGGFSRGGDSAGGGGGGDRSSRDRQNQTGRQAVRVNASADDRTNTVVVTGPPETLTVIEKVIHELDSNPASEETVFIYHLKNAQSQNVESVVNILFNGSSAGTSGRTQNTGTNRSGGYSTNRSSSRLGSGGLSGSRSSSGLGSGGGSGAFGSSSGSGGSSRFGSSGTGTGGFGSSGFGGGGFFSAALSQAAQQAASALAGQVSIIADPDTNSLLVRSSPKNYEQVKAILDDLDRPVGQVLIKVLIAEVTHDKTLDIGNQFSVLNLRASGGGQTGGTDFGLGSLNNGLVVQILETDFTDKIRLLEQTGKLDVLSRPYILASDNQLASMTVGQEVPFITRSQLTDTGQTINTIEYDDIGILLDVIPHINPDGLVTLDVAPEISALTGTTVPISETVNAPVIAKRSAQSRVAVKNGQTVVIGGLMEDRKTETINKVPILGDIPILGAAFRRHQDTKTKTELLIFLTPHVAADPDALKNMRKDELEGTKLTPNAVEPGAFQEHYKGLQRGATTKPE